MNSWNEFLKKEQTLNYYQELQKRLNKERLLYRIFPEDKDIFKAFSLTPLNMVKMVIIGQDPYHEINQANGLAFSVNEEIKIPQSLNNIYKELCLEFKMEMPKSGDLTKVAGEGVFLLNRILTVREGAPLSHKDIGWEIFTNHTISLLNDLDRPIVFVLLGREAQKLSMLITNPQHLILSAPHPSPLSCHKGFFGSNLFLKANVFLEKEYQQSINWKLLK